MEFQMIRLRASFNILLGRPGIHGLDGVASSLHQKMKLNTIENKIIELCGDSWIRASKTSSSAPILEVQLPDFEEFDMWGFEFVNVIEGEMFVEFLPLYFDQFANPMVVGIMKKMRYFLGIWLGRKH